VGIVAAGLWSTSALGAGPAPSWAVSPVAEEASHAARLNPTGRAIEIEVQLKLDGGRLGDVPIKIDADDKIFVDARLLKTYLGKIVKTEILTAALQTAEDRAVQVADADTVVSKKTPGAASSSVLQKAAIEKPAEPGQFGQEKPVYVALDLLVARGLAMRYDPQALELQVEPNVDQKIPGDISFAQQEEIDSVSLEKPAYVSAYVNMRMTASYVNQSSSGSTGVESPSFDFDAAARIGKIVLEAEGTFNTGDAKGFARGLFQNYAFYRRGTRLVYDMPEDALRIRAGDVTPEFAGLQTSPDLLGISAGKNYSQLQPSKSIRPTGAQSFRIERPSTVDILIGAALVRRLRLGPGIYNLSDLPLQAGANDIKLVIEDDTGARRTLEFTAFSGYELLAPGVSEWSISAGVKSLDNGIADYANATTPAGYTVVNKSSSHSFYGQRDYYFDQPAATAFYRRGVTDGVTAQADIQADNLVTMAGAGLVTQTKFGMLAGELAASENYEDGLGFGVKLAYGYDKFGWFAPYKATFRLAADWKSSNFATVQTYAKNGIVAPPAYNGSISASYSQTLPYDVTAGLSFSYYLLLDAQGTDSRPGDRWDTDFTLSRRLWDNVSGSLSVGYGQDKTQTAQSCCLYNRDGFRTFVRLSWTPDAHSSALATFDSRAESARVSYTQNSEKTGVGSWAATVDATAGAQDQGAINASASYVANRANVSLSHSAGLAGLGYNGAFNPSFTEERTSVSVASSFVYADGAWGIGRPVTGGFALVTPHKSLEGSPVVVGAADSVVAKSDFLGAAVVPSVGAYSRTRLAYDAPGAPAGYDLGSASYDLKAPYKAGYNLQAGSAYTITAVGTLIGADGQPLPLLAGTAREANKENGRKVELFTNRVGRFGAQGLSPGRWIIEMPTEPDLTRYVIEIPEGVVGQPQRAPLIEAGISHEAT
jgi:outer membrane usher protein